MIHFVYAGAPDNNAVEAPYTITRRIYDFLSARAPTRYYQWDSCDELLADSDDIIIGHPNYGSNTIIQKALRTQRCRAKFTIHPFHTKRVQDNFPFTDLLPHVTGVFAICGHYWIDTVAATVFAPWTEKLIHLNMAVDLDYFSFRRTKFNCHRNLVYVGSPMPHKNLDLMCELMRRMPNTRLYWFGGGGHILETLPNVTTYGRQRLTPAVLDQIVTVGDVFINTSSSDASPTALLEAAALGCPIVCTPESGIKQPWVTTIQLDALEQNLVTIRSLLCAPNEILFQRAQMARQAIVEYHSWPVFLERLWAVVSQFV